MILKKNGKLKNVLFSLLASSHACQHPISQMNKLILPNMENKRELGRHLPPLCWLVATSQSGVLQ
jgi:hypothetical protein